MLGKIFYDRHNHSNNINLTDKFSFSSSSTPSLSSSLSTSSSVLESSKSTKHSGEKRTHHQLEPSPSPIVIKTASYSPSGYTYGPYVFSGNMTFSSYLT